MAKYDRGQVRLNGRMRLEYTESTRNPKSGMYPASLSFEKGDGFTIGSVCLEDDEGIERWWHVRLEPQAINFLLIEAVEDRKADKPLQGEK